MKRIRLRRPRPGMILGVIAVVLTAAGTAVAAANLKLADFEPSSRDRLAGTGVIQYAAQTHTTGPVSPTPQTFTVGCELSKKATSGGFKWTTPPAIPADYEFVDAYPTGEGFKVRILISGPSAVAEQLTVYANCVKSRKQNGTPPS